MQFFVGKSLTNHLCQSKANFGHCPCYLDFNFSETLKTKYEKMYPGNNKCRVQISNAAHTCIYLEDLLMYIIDWKSILVACLIKYYVTVGVVDSDTFSILVIK